MESVNRPALFRISHGFPKKKYVNLIIHQIVNNKFSDGNWLETVIDFYKHINGEDVEEYDAILDKGTDNCTHISESKITLLIDHIRNWRVVNDEMDSETNLSDCSDFDNDDE